MMIGIRRQVTRDDVKVLTDTVTVMSCTMVPIDIYARITAVSQDIIETTKKKFMEKFELMKGLGWNATKLWIIANLFIEGMQNIELIEPKEDINVKGDKCIYLNDLKVELV